MNVYHITYEPETRTAYLYFWGCNFSCRGCIRRKDVYDMHLHGPQRAGNPGPVRLLSQSEIADVVNELNAKRVTCLGGDASIDQELSSLLARLKKDSRTYNILLTNGYCLPDLKPIDEIQISLKALDDRLHKDFTGKSNLTILENINLAYDYGLKLRMESILIPAYIDRQEIEAIARFIAGIDPIIPYRIDAFIPVPGTDWRQPTLEEIESAAHATRRYLRNVTFLCGKEKPRSQIRKII
ncbi:MAG TPA: radical SAM protein [Proteobacteria bacterium]|nr:radical SAM protein [Pseudomonadota bacterium]